MSQPPLTPPLSGLKGLAENWQADLIAGFLVFLIALPLSLGIAMASGFPPMSGIIAAVIGGVVVSRISGSSVTINGPAAGLIVVILSAVQSLGPDDAMAGFRYTLAAIFVAGILQIFMGLMKAGKLNAYFPASVVHGMLAAIGIIIMAKQIHTLLGVKPESKEIIDTILEIPHSISELNPDIALIGFSGLAIMVIWSLVRNRYLRMIPAPLIVVVTGMLFDRYFDLNHEHVYLFMPDQTFLPHHEYTIGPKFLVSIPGNILSSLYLPDFGKFATPEFWGAVISICLVGSLETLLSATAVDRLDPYQRQSNLNQDLTAIGVGNMLSSAIGGLPMIAEIVRSSANVNNGAQTGWSNFFHGALMALFVIGFPSLVHEIPLASLAALLVYTGFRLASPREFAKTMVIGREQLVIFTATIMGVLATDLLIGVLIGVSVKLMIHLARGVPLRDLLKMSYDVHPEGEDTYHIHISGSAIFANFIGLKSQLAEFPPGKRLIFDVTQASFIDHTVMEFIDYFSQDYISRGGQCDIRGLENLAPFSEHPLAARRQNPVAP